MIAARGAAQRIMGAMFQLNSLLALAVLCAPALADEGQGPVESGPIRVEDLNLGKYWFGPEISHKDLEGKVVLVEIYGS